MRGAFDPVHERRAESFLLDGLTIDGVDSRFIAFAEETEERTGIVLDVRADSDHSEFVLAWGRFETDVGRDFGGDEVLRIGADDDSGAGRVMPVLHAGASRDGVGAEFGHGRLGDDLAEMFEGDGAGAENARDIPRAVDDGRFQAYLCLIALEQASDPAVEILSDGLPGGRAGPARKVRRGGNDRDAAGPEKLLRHRMIGHADADRIQTGRGDQRHSR